MITKSEHKALVVILEKKLLLRQVKNILFKKFNESFDEIED